MLMAAPPAGNTFGNTLTSSDAGIVAFTIAHDKSPLSNDAAPAIILIFIERICLNSFYGGYAASTFIKSTAMTSNVCCGIDDTIWFA